MFLQTSDRLQDFSILPTSKPHRNASHFDTNIRQYQKNYDAITFANH